MNFDKFKNVVPKKIQLKYDDEYLQHLNGLKEPKQSNILRVVGTIAAAVAIVAVVALWALIGRGVRGNNVSLSYIADGADPASATELPITDEYLLKYTVKVDYIPLFDKTQPPSVVEMLEFYNTGLNKDNADRIYLGKNINNSALHYFGVTYNLEESRIYQNSGKEITDKYNQDLYEPVMKKIMRYDMGEGNYNFVITYTKNDETYILSYISTDIKEEPERFISHTKENELLKKDYADEKIFYLMEQKIFSDPNVKDYWLWLTVDKVYKINDTLYTAQVRLSNIEYYDESIAKPTFENVVFPRYFECKDGEFYISENQDRKSEGEVILKGDTYEWATDKKTVKAFSEYITKYGLVSLPEFEGKTVYASELNAESPDTEFNITYIVRGETVYDEMYEELWFVAGGKEYVVGFVAQPGGTFTIDYVLFKRENKLYTGNEKTETVQFSQLMQSFATPYSYSANEIKDNIPSELLLPQSMGITVPNIDSIMIAPFDDGPLTEMPEEYYEELEHIKEHGGDEAEVQKYFENMTKSQLMRQRMYNERAPRDSIARFKERFVDIGTYDTNIDLITYMNLERYFKARYGYRYYLDTFTEDELLELKERGIVPNDIDYLLEQFGTPQKILKASDKKLKNMLQEYYEQKYLEVFGEEYN